MNQLAMNTITMNSGHHILDELGRLLIVFYDKSIADMHCIVDYHVDGKGIHHYSTGASYANNSRVRKAP